MESFTITLSNAATLTGRFNIPSSLTPFPDSPSQTLKYRPLIVALHGGSYSSLYFDVDPKYTASSISDALCIPFVAIDRPGYEDSSYYDPIPEGSTYAELYGDWLHDFILPALWAKFGTPNHCNCIVLHCHSLGTPGAVVAAGRHARERSDKTKYPLGGLISSGWGSLAKYPTVPNAMLVPALRDEMMLPPGTAESSMYANTERLMRSVPAEERVGRKAWMPRWREEWAPLVRVPMMLAVSERDTLWEGTEEHLRDWMAGFTGSVRVDGSFIRGAPHNIELSLWSKGWYTRCFGFALECAVEFEVARK